MTGHFSQVVWKDSKEIGVGRSKTKDGKIVVVTNYRPAGNITGSYTTNVLPSAESTNYGKTGNISIVLGFKTITDPGVGQIASYYAVTKNPFATKETVCP